VFARQGLDQDCGAHRFTETVEAVGAARAKREIGPSGDVAGLAHSVGDDIAAA
jgi:hypothetical protein